MENNFVLFDRDALRITVQFKTKPPLVIDEKNIEVSYFSGGPGGQNVNKNMNGVRLLYEIPSEYTVNSLRNRKLIVQCIDERRQSDNFRKAFKHLAEKIRQYFYVKPKRRKTKPTRGSKEKRLQSKKLHGMKKRERLSRDY